MKGQLSFDESMNVSEEKIQQETSRCVECRTPMVDQCYYCLCNSCINNAESITVNPDKDKFPEDWEACFFCDDCKIFDGDGAKKNMEREWCSRYEIDNYHAKANRKKFRIVKCDKNGSRSTE